MPLNPSDAEIREALAALSAPADYYAGAVGWAREPLRDILIFSRWTREEAIDGGAHLHSRYVLCWCLEGTGTIIVDGATISGISPGRALLLFPYQQHYFADFEGNGILWAFVSFSLPAHSFLDPLRSRSVGTDGEALNRLERLIRSYHDRDGEVAPRLELLLVRLVRLAERGPVPAPESRCEPEDPLARAARFVYQHLDRALTVGEVAREVYLSPSHLRRLFSERMGISLGRFMLKARINRALALLQTSDLPVGRIAEACGFGSVYSFSRAFRKEKGTAPSSCRVPGISGGKA